MLIAILKAMLRLQFIQKNIFYFIYGRIQKTYPGENHFKFNFSFINPKR